MDLVPTDECKVMASSTKEGNEIKFSFDNNYNPHRYSCFKGRREKPPYTMDINMGRTELISVPVYRPRKTNSNVYFPLQRMFEHLGGTVTWHGRT